MIASFSTTSTTGFSNISSSVHAVANVQERDCPMASPILSVAYATDKAAGDGSLRRYFVTVLAPEKGSIPILTAWAERSLHMNS
jgi:hypothetical protein